MRDKDASTSKKETKKKSRTLLQRLIKVTYTLWVTLKTIAVLDEAVRNG